MFGRSTKAQKHAALALRAVPGPRCHWCFYCKSESSMRRWGSFSGKCRSWRASASLSTSNGIAWALYWGFSPWENSKSYILVHCDAIQSPYCGWSTSREVVPWRPSRATSKISWPAYHFEYRFGWIDHIGSFKPYYSHCALAGQQAVWKTQAGSEWSQSQDQVSPSAAIRPPSALKPSFDQLVSTDWGSDSICCRGSRSWEIDSVRAEERFSCWAALEGSSPAEFARTLASFA